MLASDMLQSRILTCQPVGRPLESSARSGGPLCCSEQLKDAATMSSFDSFFASALLRFTRSRLQRFKQSSLQLPGKIHTRNHVAIHDVQLQNTKFSAILIRGMLSLANQSPEEPIIKCSQNGASFSQKKYWGFFNVT
jgi:hypothetical protein